MKRLICILTLLAVSSGCSGLGWFGGDDQSAPAVSADLAKQQLTDCLQMESNSSLNPSTGGQC